MHRRKYVLAAAALILALLSCNLPSGAQVNAAVTALAQTATALALTATAQAGGAPAGVATATTAAPPANTETVVPSLPPTACTAFVTATMNSNVRTGPSTDYDPPVGYIPTGGTAPLLGRNDANTWWYIGFAAGPGGHGWIAQSVTTASCVPAVVPVIAAPPLPPTLTPSPTTVPPAAFAVIHVTYGFSHWSSGTYVNCPRVTASITTNGPGTVTYHWTRSDGGVNSPSTLTFGSAGTISVKYDWALGSVWNGQTFWVGIYIDDPNHQDFGHKSFNQACTSP